jgi:hypothetical protein
MNHRPPPPLPTTPTPRPVAGFKKEVDEETVLQRRALASYLPPTFGIGEDTNTIANVADATTVERSTDRTMRRRRTIKANEVCVYVFVRGCVVVTQIRFELGWDVSFRLVRVGR